MNKTKLLCHIINDKYKFPHRPRSFFFIFNTNYYDLINKTYAKK